MEDSQKHFKIFAGCRPVKGDKRSIVYDLNRHTYHLIPNGLYNILKIYDGQTVASVKLNFDKREHETIDEYFRFLEINEIIFFVEKKHLNLFPIIEDQWHTPALIANSIIEDSGLHDWPMLLKQLIDVKCKHLQIRFTDMNHFLCFAEFIKLNFDNCISFIEVIIPYSSLVSLDLITDLFENYPMILRYLVYNSPFSKTVKSDISARVAVFTTYDEAKTFSVQSVRPGVFNVEISQFIESIHHNVYFNKKMCISRKGNIKMTPHSLETFGSIYMGTTLLDVFTNDDSFKKYWKISKNMMLVCGQCEFRYMCNYEGEPVIDIDSGLYKYSEGCGYDPYSTKFVTAPLNTAP